MYNEILYSQKIIDQLKEILKNKNFNALNTHEKNIISNKVKELSILSEYNLSIDNETIYKYTCLNSLNLPGIDEFKHLLNNRLTLKINRANSADINNQFKKVIVTTTELIKNKFNLDNLDSNSTYEKILKTLKVDEIVFLSINSSLSCLDYKEYSLNYDQSSLNEITSHNLFYKLRKNIFKYIISRIINSNNINTLENLISVSLIKKINLLVNSSEFDCLNNLAKQIENIFIFSLKLKTNIKTINFKKKSKSIKLIELPLFLINSTILYNHLPEIIEPEKWGDTTLKDFLKSFKSVKNGASDVKVSRFAEKVLTDSQKKKFRINREVINLFKKIDCINIDTKNFDNMLPFTPIFKLEKMKEEIHLLESDLGCLYFNIQNIIKEKYKKNGSIKKDFFKNHKTISESDFIKSNTLYKLKKEFNLRKKLRIIHNTIIEIAEIYDNLPIYFINSIDYRTRMYPWSWFFSRTTGNYKYLMQDYQFCKLTHNGLKNMISAYYFNFTEEYQKFIDFSNSNFHKKNYKDLVKKYFKKVDDEKISKNSAFFFIKLLEIEIEKMFNNDYSTNFMVEIDQKSSSSVFLSTILKSKKLAETSNLISLKANDPAIFLMNSSKFYFKKITLESLKILTESRKLHKYLFMCFCYNESFKGRLDRLKEYGIDMDSAKIIAKEYKKFVDNVFNGLNSRITEINNIMKFVLDKTNNSINLATVDGCKLSWQIYYSKNLSQKKRKYKDPITNEYLSYHINSYDINKIDKRKIILGFLPNFIHSIDASVMRIIIYGVKKKKKNILLIIFTILYNVTPTI